MHSTVTLSEEDTSIFSFYEQLIRGVCVTTEETQGDSSLGRVCFYEGAICHRNLPTKQPINGSIWSHLGKILDAGTALLLIHIVREKATTHIGLERLKSSPEFVLEYTLHGLLPSR